MLGGSARPAGSFGTGALAAFVATPCAGPFLGAALGTALLLPVAGSVLVFAALGLGLALPFLLVAFVPALRSRLPRPGPWMARLQRFLAIPMAASAVAACGCSIGRPASRRCWSGSSPAALALARLRCGGSAASSGRARIGWPRFALLAALLVVDRGRCTMPVSRRASGTCRRRRRAVERGARSRATSQQGHPVFVYFTADWCLTCKVNEAGAIDAARSATRSTRRASRCSPATGPTAIPAITRFLESRGRAGVPLYLWYAPGKRAGGAAAGAHSGDAHFPRSVGEALAARSHTFFPATQVSSTSVRASDCASTLVGSRSTRMKSAHLPGSSAPIRSSAKPA